MRKSLHILTAVLLTAVFLSCQRTDRTPRMFQYRFEIADEGTRAALFDDGVCWLPGDRVGLFVGGTGPVAADVDVSASPSTIVFSSGNPLAAGTTVHACYPFTEGSTDVSAARIVFPAFQTGGSVSAMPMAGIPSRIGDEDGGTNGLIRFLNLGAVVDFRVFSAVYAGEKVESIHFQADAGGPVSGAATLNLDLVDPDQASSLQPVWVGDACHPYVTLQQEAIVGTDKESAAQNHLYLVLPPGTYSGTLSVVTDAAVYAFTIPDKTFPRNTLIRYNLNLKASNRQEPFNLENDSVRAYFDKVEAEPYDPSDYSYSHVAEFSADASETNRLDWPKPVTLRWLNPDADNLSKQVEVYNDAAMTDLELTVPVSFASSTSADIYNLIPGRSYYYKVSNGANLLTTGVFRTTGRRRMMRVDTSRFYMNNAINCRDFGGLMTVSGKRLRYGKIFRGSNMDDTSDEAKDILLHYMHVGLDVDLRKPPGSSSTRGECINDGLYLGEWHLTESYNSWKDLTSLDKMPGTLNRIFDVVNDPGSNRAVYIHCKVGADRTGYVCMLLQAILGVPQGWCDVDYEMTSFAGSAINENPRTRTGHGNYYYRTKSSYNWWTQETKTTVMGVDFLATMPGENLQEKAIYYLTNELGIDPDRITAFQQAMLE